MAYREHHGRLDPSPVSEYPQQPPARVRVTAPRAGQAGPVIATHSLAAPSDIDAEIVRSLIRSQLRLAIVCAVGFVLALAAYPVVFALAPGLDETFVAGVPLSWWLLGFGVYPLVLAFAVIYVRVATRNEARYRSLTDDS